MTARQPEIHVIDSHTAGEPTRVVVSGGPDLGGGPLAQRVEVFRREYDRFRSAIVNEPRGSDAMVGALLCESADATCSAGVIFFNNVGYLGMCGHGTIGLVATLAHMGRLQPGVHGIDTPVGVVQAEYHGRGVVTLDNVPSYRSAAGVSVDVPGFGRVTGDVAWGGNWFFLSYDTPIQIVPANIEALTDYAWRIRQALADAGIAGDNGCEIDHIELYGPPTVPGAHSRNFVLCPGKAYDRSPCGTGTSAKLACLFAAGKLREGEVWVQESVIGSLFEGSVALRHGVIYPRIRGAAFINAEARLLFDPGDPFQWGIAADAPKQITRSVTST
jgi:4-hydroxyproline epimerase